MTDTNKTFRIEIVRKIVQSSFVVVTAPDAHEAVAQALAKAKDGEISDDEYNTLSMTYGTLRVLR